MTSSDTIWHWIKAKPWKPISIIWYYLWLCFRRCIGDKSATLDTLLAFLQPHPREPPQEIAGHVKFLWGQWSGFWEPENHLQTTSFLGFHVVNFQGCNLWAQTLSVINFPTKLVGGFFTNPFEKKCTSQIGIMKPQGSGMKIRLKPPPTSTT